MQTESYFNECQTCWEEFDTDEEKCPKCGNDEFEVIDERKTCDLCKEQVDEYEIYECGRCGKDFCENCSGLDNIPYRTAEDYCSDCGCDFQSLWDSFCSGAEIHMDAVEVKEKPKEGKK